MKNFNKTNDYSYITVTNDFSGVVVGDVITVAKGGRTYRNVKVKGNTGKGPVRRWVSCRKVGMRWAPKGVGIMQLQIEGYLLLSVIRAEDHDYHESKPTITTVV